MEHRQRGRSRRRVSASDARRVARPFPAPSAAAAHSSGTRSSATGERLAVANTELGRGPHLVADGWSAVAERLDDDALLLDAIKQAIESIGATLVGYSAHRLGSRGISAAALLAEAEMHARPERTRFAAELAASHLVVHTWPERDYFAADLFFSGRADAEVAMWCLAKSLGAVDLQIRRV